MPRALLLVLMLAGCASGPQLPPPDPTIEQIASTWSELQASGAPPSVILNVGATLDDQGCYSWFDQQILGGQKAALASSALGMGAAGAAIAGSGAAAPAALGLLSALIGSAQANSPTGSDPVSAYMLTTRMRQAWLAAVPVPTTTDEAWAQLDAYHQLCSLSGIRSAIAQAAMTVPVSAAIPAMSLQPSIDDQPTPDTPQPSRTRRRIPLPATMSSSRPCYMSILGCSIPRVMIGGR